MDFPATSKELANRYPFFDSETKRCNLPLVGLCPFYTDGQFIFRGVATCNYEKERGCAKTKPEEIE
ncbi:hypothetical protein KBC75_03090 [Candidatus Shapirobacteria bacterium]|nr:hypothetical protein [Candidatus Shapirobacteria bacterium]